MKLRLSALLLTAWLGAWIAAPHLALGEAKGEGSEGSSSRDTHSPRRGKTPGPGAPSKAEAAPGSGGTARASRAGRRRGPRTEAAGGNREGHSPPRAQPRGRDPLQRRPWRPRRRAGVAVEGQATTVWEVMAGPEDGGLSARVLRQLGLRPRGIGLKDLGAWPAEPDSPQRWDEARFAAAFTELCPAGLGHDVAQYARFALQVSREHGTDPALLAALVYQQSECDAGRESTWGFGLTQLNRGLMPKELREGKYPYYRATQDGWEPAEVRLRPTPLSRENLLDPYTNLNLAALHLRVLEQQCPAMDRAYGSHRHRHFVSHFIWGDDVRDAGAEDRVLETRRRLLAYYNGMRKPAYVKLRGVVLVSPVDGAPRIATSGLGDDRDHGNRRHAGIDYLSRFGEPVRAIADGKVVYAGTDLAHDRKVNVEPDKATLVPPTSMGARGLFVELDHAEGLHSVYAHLAAYKVRAGDHVKRGQLLGYVGRSGIRESDPHLHFGLFADGEVMDPLVVLEGLVFGPGETVREPLPHEHEAPGHGRRRRKKRKQAPPMLTLPLGVGPTASATGP